jgi:hypothetical protein
MDRALLAAEKRVLAAPGWEWSELADVEAADPVIEPCPPARHDTSREASRSSRVPQRSCPAAIVVGRSSSTSSAAGRAIGSARHARFDRGTTRADLDAVTLDTANLWAAQRRNQPMPLLRQRLVRAFSGLIMGAVLATTATACVSQAQPRTSALTSATPSLSGSPSAPSSQRAWRACQAAIGGNVASAAGTTVGDIRSLSGGPAVTTSTGTDGGFHPGKGAFPGEPPSAFGAWCWTGHPGNWTWWGVDEHGNKVLFGGDEDPNETAPPSGPWAVP